MKKHLSICAAAFAAYLFLGLNANAMPYNYYYDYGYRPQPVRVTTTIEQSATRKVVTRKVERLAPINKIVIEKGPNRKSVTVYRSNNTPKRPPARPMNPYTFI